MGYDRGDCFPFDFEPNGIPFGSENLKENCHHDHIPFNMKRNENIVFSVCLGGRWNVEVGWQALLFKSFNIISTIPLYDKLRLIVSFNNIMSGK